MAWQANIEKLPEISAQRQIGWEIFYQKLQESHSKSTGYEYFRVDELTSYCKQSAILLQEAWIKLREAEMRPGPLASELPELPESYKEIFSRCISDADPDVADYLANVLVKLQVHHSRMKELKLALGKSEGMIFVPHNVMTYIFSLGELQALINRFFGFARGMEPFNDSNIVWEDYRNAYSNLDIDAEDVDDLVGFTERAISRRT